MDEHQDNSEHAARRKQSAKFVLQNKDENTLDITEAMDTAHQSLTSSLHLSFRALQLAMLVLVCLYLVSGFRTVEDSQTGVGTFFGKITDKQGLQPGLQTNWPPPIGGFEVYAAQHREANIGHVFKPRIDARLSPDQRISKAKSSDGLRPGRDGSLLTSDGDLAHIGISSSWEIVDPVAYAHAIPDADANLFVTSALEKAAVHIVGKLTIEELLDKPLEELRELIMQDAQQTLNTFDCGIRISDVIIPSEPEPPLYIQKSYAAFDSARIKAETSIERAVASAHETLIEAAGSNYDTLLTHIDAYEYAAEQGDTQSKDENLSAINAMLQE